MHFCEIWGKEPEKLAKKLIKTIKNLFMKKVFLSLVALLVLGSVSADDQVLMTINGKPIMASEFMYIYQKNNQGTNAEQKTMDDYVDLFVNFKLKVEEALSRGLDTTAEYQKELAGYRGQAAAKYMTDSAAFDSLVVMSYQRMAHPRRAAHITIQCPMNSDEAATAEALAKIEAARERVVKGEDFGKVALEVSTDPGVQENQGELGWITPFRYVYAFEDAVYTTPVGEVTPIFRSGYGFHIALVEEEGVFKEVKASHIMKMVPQNNEAAAESQRLVLDSIYRRFIEGESFSDLARECSDDKGSAIKGGDLGWFGQGMMVKPFEDAVMGMKVPSVCKPIRSRFGWHIIFKSGERNIQPLEEIRSQIERNVTRDERSKQMEVSFIKKARQEYNLPATMTDNEVKEYANLHLEEKYPEFNALVREYHDGILLFDVSLEEVWDKAAKDSIGLENYFKAHKNQYKWDAPRFKGYLLSCQNEEVATIAKQIIKNAHPDSVQSYLKQRLNTDSTNVVTCVYGLWAKGQNASIDKYVFGNKDAKVKENEALPFVTTMGKKIKRPETYMDVRNQVTTDYQDYLEQEWVKSLRAKYPVVINNEVLNELKQQVSAR